MKLLLVDGHYFAYRSFFGMQPLTHSSGRPVGAVFGFAKTLRRMLENLKPDLAAVVFDGGLPERRLILQPEYKSQRAPMPEDLAAQLSGMQKITEAFGVQAIRMEGQEADDIIATLTRRAPSGTEIVLATCDKDLMQLVTENVRLCQPSKGSKGFDMTGEKEVFEKWGVPPAKIPDLLALTGDSSDNIPGVPSVGPKTAAVLLQEFGSIENLLGHISEIKSQKVRSALELHKTQVICNHEMVKLDYSLEVPVAWNDLKISLRPHQMRQTLLEFEFHSMLRELERGTATPPAVAQGELF